MNEHLLKENIFSILKLLSSKEDLTQRDLSSHIGISLGKTNYLLKELIRIGLLEIKNFTVRGQKASKVRYLLTKEGLEEKMRLTYQFLKEKEEGYRSIQKEWESLSNKEAKTKACLPAGREVK